MAPVTVTSTGQSLVWPRKQAIPVNTRLPQQVSLALGCPIGFAKPFLELQCSLRLFLFILPSFPLSFHGYQICIMFWRFSFLSHAPRRQQISCKSDPFLPSAFHKCKMTQSINLWSSSRESNMIFSYAPDGTQETFLKHFLSEHLWECAWGQRLAAIIYCSRYITIFSSFVLSKCSQLLACMDRGKKKKDSLF